MDQGIHEAELCHSSARGAVQYLELIGANHPAAAGRWLIDFVQQSGGCIRIRLEAGFFLANRPRQCPFHRTLCPCGIFKWLGLNIHIASPE